MAKIVGEYGVTRWVRGISWLIRHKYELVDLTITEQADGGAVVSAALEDGTTFHEEWGSFEVARGYFGVSKGWKGTKALTGVYRTFHFLSGRIEVVQYGGVAVHATGGRG